MGLLIVLAAAIALAVAAVYIPARLVSGMFALFTKFMLEESTR